jgi:signal peptidase I
MWPPTLSKRWLLLLLPLLLLPFLAIVPDDDMAPSLQKGDLILLLPIKPRVDDTVAVVDPLDPGRWTLRRLVARDGTVRYQQGMLIASTAENVVEMGTQDGMVVVKEGGHLAQHLEAPVDWDMEEREIGDGRVFLSADNREVAMDSRWWGAMPENTVQAVVLFRVGRPGNPWRHLAGWRP